MSDEILIMGLKRKYAHLVGELQAAQKSVTSLKADIETVRAALALFKAEGELAGVKPVAPAVSGRWFSRGQCSRAVMETMRKAERPLTLREIAERVLTATKVGPLSEADMKRVCTSVRYVLTAKPDLFRSDGKTPAHWAVALGDEIE